tara:strand:+ start:377 stop:751 length:375 start_codon:yes stop_codon:yes gene_type:complete
MKVKVYYNLHKNCYSIVSLEKENYGRVIKHENCVPLFDAQFKVSEKGRQRVLREQKKNVHAYVVGTWVSEFVPRLPIKLATYNPYKYSSFVDAHSKKPLAKASQVLLSKRHFVGRQTSQIYYVA